VCLALAVALCAPACAQSTQIDAVKMTVTLPSGWKAAANPGEYRYQPSGQPAVFVAQSGDLVFYVISHDIGGGSINDIGSSYDAYYRKLLGQEPSSLYRYVGGRVLYQAAYAGPGRTIGYLLEEHKETPLASVNLWGINEARGVGIYFQCPRASYEKHKDAIEVVIRSIQFQGAADKREAILLQSPEFGGLVVGNPHDPKAPEVDTNRDLPKVDETAASSNLSTTPTPGIAPPPIQDQPAQAPPPGVNPADAAPTAPAPSVDDAACAVPPGDMDALAKSAKSNCDLALFLQLMQSASPEEQRLIKSFLEAMRSGK
jgi:hypothetical protein